MSSRTVLLAALAVGVIALPASSEQMEVGLTVGSIFSCNTGSCLRRVPGRFHMAEVSEARPLKTDRRACAEVFDAYLVAAARNASLQKRQLYRMRRCRALGLAPMIERVEE